MTRTRTAIALVSVGCVAVLLTGCAAQQQSPSGAAQPTSGRSGQARNGQQRVPGAFGLIAEITGKTAQIQGTGSQTSVTFNDATVFTAQVQGAVADLTVGACVTVRSSSTDASGTVTASTISVSQPVNGACQSLGGFGGGAPGAMPPGGTSGQGTPGAMPPGAGQGTPPAGDPDGGQPGAMPSGFPSGVPSGFPSGAGGRPVSGTIASVASGTLTVTSATPAGSSATPTTTTVTVGSDAVITKTADSSAAAMKVGGCAWANGTTDSTGMITATSIRLSDAVNGVCTMA